MEQLVVMGRVDSPYGIRGWVNVQPFTSERDTLLEYRSWWVGAVEREVVQARTQGDHLVVRFAGVADRDQALRLKGNEVAVPRSKLPVTQAGEHYWVDLIGLEVVNRAGEKLGRLAGFMSHAGHDVLQVRADDGAERLIPYTDTHVLGVDLAARRIDVDWALDW